MNPDNTNETPLQNGGSEAQSVHCSAWLAVFDGLSEAEQRAWLGWFAGGKTSVIKWGTLPHVNFGKFECEQVDFDTVWLGKFVEYGWLTVREVRRFKALGMTGQPESVEYEFKATGKGCSVRNSFWERLKSCSANRLKLSDGEPVTNLYE